MRTTVGVIIVEVAAFLVLTLSVASGAGVTIITHGFNGNVTDWIIPMAERIPDYDSFPGAEFTCYEIFVNSDYSLSGSRIRGTSPTISDSGEIIIKLDWSALATDLLTSTTDIADTIVPPLLSTTFVPELGGRSLVEFPIHLIGHSRGGSVVSEMARLLGAQGVWVDHVTTLDPHPVSGYGDAEVYLYLNTLFADNYWQTNPDLFCPNGESILGAYNRYLANLQNGYSCNHSDTHLWYHGTIDWFTTPTTDTQATISSSERSTWWTTYEHGGLFAGLNWSLIGRGNRQSSDEPAGVGTGRIRDGYNQAWDFGAGVSANRYTLPANNGSWPNIIKFDIVGSNTVTVGAAVSNTYFFQFGQSSSQTATVQIFLDQDANPYNGNSGQTAQIPETGTSTLGVRSRTISFNATNPPGEYYVYAKVTGGGHVRYLHAPQKLTIDPPPDTTRPTVSITNPPSATTYTNSQTVTIAATATDNVAVARVEFYDGAMLKGTDNVLAYTYDWSFSEVDNGVHLWTARAYDAAGNIATSAPVTLTVSIDVTAPVVSITSPTNGQIYTTNPTTISGTASDPGLPNSGLSIVEVRINSGSWVPATGTLSWSRSVTLSPCANVVEARARDTAGNYSVITSAAVTYVAPNTVPSTPNNVSPTNGASGVPLSPTLEANAFSDPDCIGDTHAASQWEVLSSSGAILIADSGTDTVNKVSWTVPAGKLYFGSNYMWQVRYQDNRNGWSGYSPPTLFTTIGPLLYGSKQGTNLVLTWPTNAPGFALQWSSNLGGLNWSNATPPAVIFNGQYTVTNSTSGSKFYRLKK